MAQQRLDPEHPKAVPVTVKFGATDASRVIELASQAGVSQSEFVRSAVLGVLEREDTGPPEDGG
jgi:hypothetical protein